MRFRRFPYVGLILFIAIPAEAAIFVNVKLVTGANDGSSWANAFRGPQALQPALAAAPAGSGTEIWIAAGRYTPTTPSGNRSISFVLKSGITLYGGFAGSETLLSQRNPAIHVTILSGDLNGNDIGGGDGDNSLHVVRGTDVDAMCVVDGVVIEGGQASGTPNVDDENGANVLLVGGGPVFRGCTLRNSFAIGSGGGAGLIDSSPRIEGCTFFNCWAQQMGGGIANIDGGSPVIEGCLFDSNVGGHGVGIYSGPPGISGSVDGLLRVSDCIFQDNEGLIGAASGVGLMLSRAAAEVVRCRFINNTTGAGGGGMYVLDSPLVAVSCDFVRNSAPGDGGGGVYIDGGFFAGGPSSGVVPRFVNCRFVGNNGAIFVNFDGIAETTNCTFANNGYGFAIFSWPAVLVTNGSSLSIRNSVVWGNRPVFSQDLAGILFGGGVITVDSSCVEFWDGSRPAVGTFAADPLFVDGDGGDGIVGTLDDDVRLTGGSVCVDAGNGAFVPADAADIDDDGDESELLPLDLDGGRRVAGCAIDLGAYERAGGAANSGDMNGDGDVSAGDVDAFVAALLTGGLDCLADTNQDGATNGLDVAGFVECLIAGGCG